MKERYMTEVENKKEECFFWVLCKLSVIICKNGHHRVLDSDNLFEYGGDLERPNAIFI